MSHGVNSFCKPHVCHAGSVGFVLAAVITADSRLSVRRHSVPESMARLQPLGRPSLPCATQVHAGLRGSLDHLCLHYWLRG